MYMFYKNLRKRVALEETHDGLCWHMIQHANGCYVLQKLLTFKLGVYYKYTAFFEAHDGTQTWGVVKVNNNTVLEWHEDATAQHMKSLGRCT